MNILDEKTKAMLDAGKVAVLDGGYIVVTPETLFETVREATLETLGDITMGQAVEEEANGGFIQRGFKCHFCGKESEATEYTLKITGGYFSGHDTESKTLEVCAGCLEAMLAAAN